MPENNSHSQDHAQITDLHATRRREQAAALVEQQRATILARIHRILGNDARRVTDTEDVLSTALRRVDRAIERGSFEAQSDAHFFAFVHGVIEKSILEKARTSTRLTKREQIAQRLKSLHHSHDKESQLISAGELEQVGKAIRDPVDREIVLLRGRGNSFAVIAETMGMTPFAIRKRWSRIRKLVHQYIVEQHSDDVRQ